MIYFSTLQLENYIQFMQRLNDKKEKVHQI